MAESLKAKGLAFFGLLPLGEEPDYARFSAWLDEGRQAGMQYLEENRELRRDPRALLAGARSVIVYGLGYFQGDLAPARSYAGPPRVAQYARIRDYHRVLWAKGGQVLEELLAKVGPGHAGRVVADSAPILERALAARSGRGFIGKNTCFIERDEGSFYVLAEILTTLPPETPVSAPTDGCGTCRRCQVHCPTGALDQDYRLDANKCLSYWTIEHRGTIPERFWPWMRQYWFGCDICQLVCPYNRAAKEGDHIEALKRVPPVADLFEVATMAQPDYERMFGGTPMTRAKRDGLVRNALIAMRMMNDFRLDDALRLAEEITPWPMVLATIAQVRAYRG